MDDHIYRVWKTFVKEIETFHSTLEKYILVHKFYHVHIIILVKHIPNLKLKWYKFYLLWFVCYNFFLKYTKRISKFKYILEFCTTTNEYFQQLFIRDEEHLRKIVDKLGGWPWAQWRTIKNMVNPNPLSKHYYNVNLVSHSPPPPSPLPSFFYFLKTNLGKGAPTVCLGGSTPKLETKMWSA